MEAELEEKLYKKYPKLFVERNLPMTQTCMCWGLECSRGWFSILNNMCHTINWHIKQTRKSAATIKQYNRILKQAINGNTKNLSFYYKTRFKYQEEEIQKFIERDLEKKEFRQQWQEIPSQLVFTQIKEKYGTLRVYSHGGDNFCSGVIAMTEAMSAVTCENCGLPGSSNDDGWITTLCDACRK